MQKMKKSRKTKLFITVAIILAILGVYALVAYIKHYPPFAAASKVYAPGEQTTNLQRSDTEKAATNTLQGDQSQKVQNNQSDTPQVPTATTTSGKTAVNVTLTTAGIYNGTVSAGGMVTNIVEEGGQCSYTFTNGFTVITKTSSTLVNPTSTTCKTVSFPSSELSQSGIWQVKLGYSSTAAEGVSTIKEITK